MALISLWGGPQRRIEGRMSFRKSNAASGGLQSRAGDDDEPHPRLLRPPHDLRRLGLVKLVQVCMAIGEHES